MINTVSTSLRCCWIFVGAMLNGKYFISLTSDCQIPIPENSEYLLTLLVSCNICTFDIFLNVLSTLQSTCIFFLELKEPHVSILFATWSFLLHVWLYKANSCCYDKHLRGEREWREIYYNSQFVPVVTWSHDARSLWMSKLPHDGQEAERIGNQKPLSTFKNEHSISFFFTFYPFTFPPLFKMLPVANNQEFNTWASADISYSNDYILPLFSKSLWLPHNMKCIYSIQKSLQS